MKNYLLLFISIYCFSCEQKPSEIDQKLQQEQIEYYRDAKKSHEILIKKMYNNIENRGNQNWEDSLFESTFKQHKFFLKVNNNFQNTDSLQKLFLLYQQQLKTTNLLFQKHKYSLKYDFEKEQNLLNKIIENSSFENTELFRYSFYKNHNTILKECFQWTQSLCCFCFNNPYLGLEAQEYTHGDTIHGGIFFEYSQPRSPLFPTININGKSVEKFQYSQIVDSTQKTSLDINISHFKTMQKDTNFNVQVNYQLK